MAYQIQDNGASIRISSNQGEILVFKKIIRRINIVQSDILQIDTGNPLQNIFFRFSEVAIPLLDSPLSLRDFINSLITT